ncbi:MAG: hypothetical protein LIR46_03395 [Bacteroidota bacterium]|nr:hypothetical protein [Bacteroidota bacterium]
MAISPLPIPAMPGAMEALTTQMAGMTADSAYNQFMDQQYQGGNDLQIGYTIRTSETPAITGDTSDTISSNTNPDPVDAWHDYVENDPDGVSQITGGIVSGSNASTIALSIMEKTDLSAEAVVPVAIPLDAAIVAASQALGISMDAAQLEVETKQRFANSIVQGTGMIYDKARGLVLSWKDSLGNILFPKSAVEAVKSVIDDEGIGVTERQASYSNVPYPAIPGPYPLGGDSFGITIVNDSRYNYAEFYSDVSGGYWVGFRSGSGQYASYSWYYLKQTTSNFNTHSRERFHNGTWTSQSNNSSNVLGTVNGKQYRYTTAGFYPYLNMVADAPYMYDGTVSDYYKYLMNVVNAIEFGTISEAGGWPEGTSESEAPSYTPAELVQRGSIMGQDNARIPVVIINIPENPYDSTGSTIDPSSETDDENAGVIYPGLPGYVPDLDDPSTEPTEENVPIPLPIPDTKPSNPNVPLVNPSVIDSTRIEELVEELANTIDPQPGQSSGIIPVPPLPGITDPQTGQTTFPSIIPQSGPGFIHVYNPTPAEFVAFGSWLWVTYADATIDKILNNPFDGVIGAHELYATPNRSGRDNIRSAFLTCPTTADLVPDRYSEIDCGTVIVPEFYANYLDYSPYSQAYIYLPFIGINEVSIDDIVGHAVNIRYRVDSYSGSCIAMIFVAKDGYQNLCYQFAGNCSVEVPMAGGSQAAIKAAEMQAEAYARAAMPSAVGNAFGGLASGMMGSVGGFISGIAGAVSDYANAKAGVEAARVAHKSSVQHSGQFGASHGAMGEKVPFIIIRNPIQVKVVNYNDDYGYPAHKRVIVGGCTGYLRVREVNVVSAHATDDEKAAIEALLKNGVYVS